MLTVEFCEARAEECEERSSECREPSQKREWLLMASEWRLTGKIGDDEWPYAANDNEARRSR